jgi:hypothetical protein
MDINIVYNKMMEKLRASNNLDVIAELENSDAGAATGSEALMATGFYLSSLKHSNPFVYELIKEQIMEYLNYCKQNGLIIKQ